MRVVLSLALLAMAGTLFWAAWRFFVKNDAQALRYALTLRVLCAWAIVVSLGLGLMQGVWRPHPAWHVPLQPINEKIQ